MILRIVNNFIYKVVSFVIKCSFSNKATTMFFGHAESFNVLFILGSGLRAGVMSHDER